MRDWSLSFFLTFYRSAGDLHLDGRVHWPVIGGENVRLFAATARQLREDNPSAGGRLSPTNSDRPIDIHQYWHTSDDSTTQIAFFLAIFILRATTVIQSTFDSQWLNIWTVAWFSVYDLKVACGFTHPNLQLISSRSSMWHPTRRRFRKYVFTNEQKWHV